MIFLTAVAFFAAPEVLAASAGPNTLPREAVEEHRTTKGARVLRELAEFVAIPNIASDTPKIRQNAEHLLGLLQKHGLSGQLLEEKDAPPAVFAELRIPNATHTVVFYAHYDGQPVDPTQWHGSPWTPTLRNKALNEGGHEIQFPKDREPILDEWRLYGRSTSDDKGAIVAILTALEAMREARITPSVNLKFYFEGEEEAGSPHLRKALAKRRDLLKADAWIFCDGPVHQSRKLQVVYGVRGMIGVELTVFGANRALHSGHYGNWALNPASLLANLLSTLRDSDGQVKIRGFYDAVKPLTRAEREAVSGIPAVDASLRRSFGLAHTEAKDASIAGRILLPALNIRGLHSGHVGAQAANAIPTEARASIDFRLVPNLTPDVVKGLFEEHLKAQGFHVVHATPDEETRLKYAPIARVDWDEAGYPGIRTAMELPFARAVFQVVSDAAGSPVVKLPNMGGSLPLYLIQEVLGAPFVIVPIANHDNNQHAANENLRMRNLWDGVHAFAALLANLGLAWDAAAAHQNN